MEQISVATFFIHHIKIFNFGYIVFVQKFVTVKRKRDGYGHIYILDDPSLVAAFKKKTILNVG